MAHCNAVCDGDCRKFARRTFSSFDAHLCCLRLTVQRDVAWRCFVPARCDTNEGLVNFRLRHTHSVVVRPMWRAGRALGHMAAGQFAFVKLGHEVLPKCFGTGINQQRQRRKVRRDSSGSLWHCQLSLKTSNVCRPLLLKLLELCHKRGNSALPSQRARHFPCVLWARGAPLEPARRQHADAPAQRGPSG